MGAFDAAEAEARAAERARLDRVARDQRELRALAKEFARWAKRSGIPQKTIVEVEFRKGLLGGRYRRIREIGPGWILGRGTYENAYDPVIVLTNGDAIRYSALSRGGTDGSVWARNIGTPELWHFKDATTEFVRSHGRKNA